MTYNEQGKKKKKITLSTDHSTAGQLTRAATGQLLCFDVHFPHPENTVIMPVLLGWLQGLSKVVFVQQMVNSQQLFSRRCVENVPEAVFALLSNTGK